LSATFTSLLALGASHVLQAQFTATHVNVDGEMDAAYARATASKIENAYDNSLSAPAATCPTSGEVRALWDGTALYLVVSVNDPLVNTTADPITNKDGVEFWIDHFNDKVAKFQEDDGTMTLSAPVPEPMEGFSANRPQNTIYDNVTSRYLRARASARTPSGYNVEIAWYLGEHARANGASFGFDFGINEVDAGNTRRCRVFWNKASRDRSTNDNREWGTVILSGYDGSSPMQLDTFMLGKNLAKAVALARGIWKDETALDKALVGARTAMKASSQREIDKANLALDSAMRGLRRKGPYPDPYDLPEVKHLPDPFRFFDGRKVKTRADWDRRREEIKDLMQYYEFGRKPQKPVLAAVSHNAPPPRQTRHIDIRVSQSGRTGSFEALLALPTPEQAAASGKSAPFPVIISLDREMRFDHPIYLDAGYAVLSLPTRRIQSDDVAHTGAVFDLYPYDVAADIGSLVGWAWGASRALDALEQLLATDPTYENLLDMNKLAVTGFSRWGKGALLAGMLDERFKVTHAGASGSGGAAPYRFMPFGNEYAWGRTDGSEVLGDHMRHQTHNSNEMMRRFLNDTVPSTLQGRMYQTRTRGYGERLPFDHHLEIAAIAPRAVLISNTNDDYGNNPEGDAIGYQGALPVFEFLGAADKLALDIYMGGGGHSLKVSQAHNFVRFLDYVLYGVPLPKSPPPGDATSTPTDVQLRRDPYLTGGKDGISIYDRYYGGFRTMMPWRKRRR
jgi:endo-1,4-beta-xylanase